MSSHEEQGRAPLHYCICIRFRSAYFKVGDNIREICVHDKTDTQQTPSFVSGRSLLLSGFDPNHPAADSMIHEMGCPACLIVEGKKRFSNCGIEGEQILLLVPARCQCELQLEDSIGRIQTAKRRCGLRGSIPHISLRKPQCSGKDIYAI